MFNWKNNKRKTLAVAIPFLVAIIVGIFYLIYYDSEPESRNVSFPFENAKVIYKVNGKSPVGLLIGNLKYRVTEVTENSYTVTLEVTGNLYKIPGLENHKTKRLEKDEPISFSTIISKSSIVEEKILKMKKREIKVKKYYFKKKKGFGKEEIVIFMPEKISVPLIVNYSYGNEYKLHIELTKTNIRYLQ